MGVSEKLGVPDFGVLVIRTLLFRVLYQGPQFSEAPVLVFEIGPQSKAWGF